ncbi:hypothetical protein EQP59_04965 [Ornithobacterium rhinotracheale]|uniref:Uncharacterized protein n=1 Tax=Ornithobacterium rhinotracheale TaxID=28251 RepID=A0A410JRE7_ORNRH|nr:hypothetical protein [Ornithobacterium rhinotracheale]MRJ08776.1 hypothetical protein [Ornithobacterium rhinotracheale]MRJ10761.1 hypothetical protein [Ornithobacterium rhinotracheale]QAR30735.1 hypothetical protein EQP59_04965 [Ornithobacterium rhinotracheale]UOH77080.1 hypothetical protein MT996_07595 [Ornithobacterium rhinotracheale]
MQFKLQIINDLLSEFGEGYCIEMPTSKSKLDEVLNFLKENDGKFHFYANLEEKNKKWFHGIHINFGEKEWGEIETIMSKVCKILDLNSYCALDHSQSIVIDADNDLVGWVCFDN